MNVIKKMDNWLEKSYERGDLEWKLAKEDVIRGQRNYILGTVAFLFLVLASAPLGVTGVGAAVYVVGAFALCMVFVIRPVITVNRKVKEHMRQHDQR